DRRVDGFFHRQSDKKLWATCPEFAPNFLFLSGLLYSGHWPWHGPSPSRALPGFPVRIDDLAVMEVAGWDFPE
ncbi:MAG: hypothetical protein WC076_12050, partial [Terrimicrobiaceae bacterium]